MAFERQQKLRLFNTVFALSILGEVVCFSCCAQITLESPNKVERSVTMSFGGIGRVRLLGGGGFVVSRGIGGVVLTNDFSVIWPPGSSSLYYPFAVQSDGRFVCVGNVGNTNHCISRINLDRTLDATFQSPAVLDRDLSRINDVQSQADGKVLVGCYPPTVSERPSPYSGINKGMFRLLSDGSDDPTFQVANPAVVRQIMLTSEGKIIANHLMTVVRYLTNGAFDAAFAPINTDAMINQMAMQADGKIVLAGDFSKVNGVARAGLARANSDGTIDFSFNPAGTKITPQELRIQADGSILINNAVSIRRVFSNGQADPSFHVVQAGGNITGIAVDGLDHIYYCEDQYLRQVSGHSRVIAPPADIAVVLEKSATIDSGWTAIKTVPANVAVDQIIDTDFPGIGNTFFRNRPAQ